MINLELLLTSSFLFGRAVQFGNWCMDMHRHFTRVPDRPLSLFEGLAGTIHFLQDLLDPDRARFPAFLL
jgi:hypothetical protein